MATSSTLETCLNAQAPEFFPNKLNKLQPPHNYHYAPFPRQPHFYFYPTNTKHAFHPSSFYFHFHPNHTFPFSQSQHKLSPFHHSAALEKQELKKDVVVEHRRSDNGLRFHGYECGRKGLKNVAEKDKKFDHRLRKNHHYGRNVGDTYFRAFHDHHKNNRNFPVVPVRPDGNETTVMIKNIPSKYTRDMLVMYLENHCMVENAKEEENGEENTFAFDFVYLPIDFRSGLNKGYAFVNFTKATAAWKFLLTASDRKWELFLSRKIRQVVAARLQGKEKLESHFESMNFPCSSDDVLPVSFSPPRDGVTKGNQKTMGKLLFKPTTTHSNYY